MFKKVISFLVLSTFLCVSVIPAEAQGVFQPQSAFSHPGMATPYPGSSLLDLSESYQPSLLSGIKIFPKEPFRFDFLLSQEGNSTLSFPRRRESTGHNGRYDQNMPAWPVGRDPRLHGDDNIEAMKLVKYFLASLTVPEGDLWVNLSPHEPDRIIPDALGQTQMGHDLLAQDYILKKLTASLMHPDGETGRKFWDRIYIRIYSDKVIRGKSDRDRANITSITDHSSTIDQIPDFFNKIWIVPDQVEVYQNNDVAYITNAKLKVMTESDYVAEVKSQDLSFPCRRESTGHNEQYDQNMDPRLHGDDNSQQPVTSNSTKQIIKDIIIPVIEHEVNHGKHFAPLRQIFYSMILAKWYESHFKNSLIGRKYVDQNKVSSLSSSGLTRGSSLDSRLRGNDNSRQTINQIYQSYLDLFKTGVTDVIREEYDPVEQKLVTRKYFSGGVEASNMMIANNESISQAMLSNLFSSNNYSLFQIDFEPVKVKLHKISKSALTLFHLMRQTFIVLPLILIFMSSFAFGQNKNSGLTSENKASFETRLFEIFQSDENISLRKDVRNFIQLVDKFERSPSASDEEFHLSSYSTALQRAYDQGGTSLAELNQILRNDFSVQRYFNDVQFSLPNFLSVLDDVIVDEKTGSKKMKILEKYIFSQSPEIQSAFFTSKFFPRYFSNIEVLEKYIAPFFPVQKFQEMVLNHSDHLIKLFNIRPYEWNIYQKHFNEFGLDVSRFQNLSLLDAVYLIIHYDIFKLYSEKFSDVDDRLTSNVFGMYDLNLVYFYEFQSMMEGGFEALNRETESSYSTFFQTAEEFDLFKFFSPAESSNPHQFFEYVSDLGGVQSFVVLLRIFSGLNGMSLSRELLFANTESFFDLLKNPGVDYMPYVDLLGEELVVQAFRKSSKLGGKNFHLLGDASLELQSNFGADALPALMSFSLEFKDFFRRSFSQNSLGRVADLLDVFSRAHASGHVLSLDDYLELGRIFGNENLLMPANSLDFFWRHYQSKEIFLDNLKAFSQHYGFQFLPNAMKMNPPLAVSLVNSFGAAGEDSQFLPLLDIFLGKESVKHMLQDQPKIVLDAVYVLWKNVSKSQDDSFQMAWEYLQTDGVFSTGNEVADKWGAFLSIPFVQKTLRLGESPKQIRDSIHSRYPFLLHIQNHLEGKSGGRLKRLSNEIPDFNEFKGWTSSGVDSQETQWLRIQYLLMTGVLPQVNQISEVEYIALMNHALYSPRWSSSGNANSGYDVDLTFLKLKNEMPKNFFSTGVALHEGGHNVSPFAGFYLKSRVLPKGYEGMSDLIALAGLSVLYGDKAIEDHRTSFLNEVARFYDSHADHHVEGVYRYSYLRETLSAHEFGRLQNEHMFLFLNEVAQSNQRSIPWQKIPEFAQKIYEDHPLIFHDDFVQNLVIAILSDMFELSSDQTKALQNMTLDRGVHGLIQRNDLKLLISALPNDRAQLVTIESNYSELDEVKDENGNVIFQVTKRKSGEIKTAAWDDKMFENFENPENLENPNVVVLQSRSDDFVLFAKDHGVVLTVIFFKNEILRHSHSFQIIRFKKDGSVVKRSFKRKNLKYNYQVDGVLKFGLGGDATAFFWFYFDVALIHLLKILYNQFSSELKNSVYLKNMISRGLREMDFFSPYDVEENLQNVIHSTTREDRYQIVYDFLLENVLQDKNEHYRISDHGSSIGLTSVHLARYLRANNIKFEMKSTDILNDLYLVQNAKGSAVYNAFRQVVEYIDSKGLIHFGSDLKKVNVPKSLKQLYEKGKFIYFQRTSPTVDEFMDRYPHVFKRDSVDIFDGALPKKQDDFVIVGNLLRYFTVDENIRALKNLGKTVKDGGYLIAVLNARSDGVEVFTAWKRNGDVLELVQRGGTKIDPDFRDPIFDEIKLDFAQLSDSNVDEFGSNRTDISNDQAMIDSEKKLSDWLKVVETLFKNYSKSKAFPYNDFSKKFQMLVRQFLSGSYEKGFLTQEKWQEIHTRMNDLWVKYGMTGRFGILNQNLAEVLIDPIWNLRMYRLMSFRLFQFLQSGSAESAFIGLFARILMEGHHLRNAMTHFEQEGWSGSVYALDQDSLVVLGRQYVNLIVRAFLKPSKNQWLNRQIHLRRSNGSLVRIKTTWRDVALWGLVLLTDPYLYNPRGHLLRKSVKKLNGEYESVSDPSDQGFIWTAFDLNNFQEAIQYYMQQILFRNDQGFMKKLDDILLEAHSLPSSYFTSRYLVDPKTARSFFFESYGIEGNEHPLNQELLNRKLRLSLLSAFGSVGAVQPIFNMILIKNVLRKISSDIFDEFLLIFFGLYGLEFMVKGFDKEDYEGVHKSELRGRYKETFSHSFFRNKLPKLHEFYQDNAQLDQKSNVGGIDLNHLEIETDGAMMDMDIDSRLHGNDTSTSLSDQIQIPFLVPRIISILKFEDQSQLADFLNLDPELFEDERPDIYARFEMSERESLTT